MSPQNPHGPLEFDLPDPSRPPPESGPCSDPEGLGPGGFPCSFLAAWTTTEGLAGSWPRALKLFFAGLGGLILLGLAFDASELVDRAFRASTALGLTVISVLAVTVAAALHLAWAEVQALRRLRRIEALRGEGEALLETAGYGAGHGFAQSIAQFYRERDDLTPVLTNLETSLHDAHNDREVVALVERHVLAPLDQSAYRAVLAASRDIAIATALSPSAALDIAIVLWRNLRLVREVATLYGARPGPLGSWRLMRRMLANLAVAGVSESLTHVTIDALGGSLAAAISTRLGQGVLNGLLTARIGLASMTLCRPLAFSPENRPSLKQIRNELMGLPKAVL